MRISNLIDEVLIKYMVENYNFICEATIGEIKDKYYSNIPQEDFDSIVKSDTLSSNFDKGKIGMYAKWMLKLYSNNKLNMSKLDKVGDYLNKFKQGTSSGKIEIKDVNKYNSLEELFNVIDNIDGSLSKSDEVRIIKEDSRLVYEDSKFKIIQPLSEDSSIYYGKSTKWCTASTDAENMFDGYNERGNLYIIFDKNSRNVKGDYDKYQLHFENGEFRDATNREINIETRLKLKDAVKAIIKKDNVKEKIILNNELNILFIDNPSDTIKDNAIQLDPQLVKYLDDVDDSKFNLVNGYVGLLDIFEENPSEEIKLQAVEMNPKLISIIDNPSEEVQIIAVDDNCDYIRYIKNPTEKVQLMAVDIYAPTIQYIDNPSEAVQLKAVENDGTSIRFIYEKGITPSEELLLKAIIENCETIQYINNPSENIQMKAVEKDAEMIKYIINKNITPSEKIQIKAVENDGLLIKYIKNPSERVQLKAIENDIDAMEYIKNPSERVQLNAVEIDSSIIEYINNPSENVQLKAVEDDYENFKYIKNPTEKVKALYNKLRMEQ